MISISQYFKNKDEILGLLDLDEICFRILTYMLLSSDDSFSHNKLRKELDKPPFTMREPTYTTHLKHLEKKNLITREKSSHKTKITLNEKGLFLISRKKEFKKMMKDYSDTFRNIKKLSTEEIYKKLETYSIAKVYKSLYQKLVNLLEPEYETEKKLLNRWIILTHDNIVEIYLDELKKRGNDEIKKIIDIHLNR